MILDNGWRWSIRFAATLSALMAIASPAYASIDGYDNVSDVNSQYVSTQKVIDAETSGGAATPAAASTSPSSTPASRRSPGLDAPGKVVHGPDLSFDSQDPSCATATPTATGPTWPASSPARDAGASIRSTARTAALPRRRSRRAHRLHQGR